MTAHVRPRSESPYLQGIPSRAYLHEHQRTKRIGYIIGYTAGVCRRTPPSHPTRTGPNMVCSHRGRGRPATAHVGRTVPAGANHVTQSDDVSGSPYRPPCNIRATRRARENDFSGRSRSPSVSQQPPYGTDLRSPPVARCRGTTQGPAVGPAQLTRTERVPPRPVGPGLLDGAAGPTGPLLDRIRLPHPAGGDDGGRPRGRRP